MKKAKIAEIFSSIQGEGLYAGEEQIFVRFYGCNLSCGFCDEKQKILFSEYTPAGLAERVMEEEKGTVSLTGGEPLLQADFLKETLPLLKAKGRRTYLETNGTLVAGLLETLDHVDIVSMDIKLPSSTGIRPFWREHTLFLKEAAAKDVFVKAVVTPETLLSDIETAVSIVRSVNKNIPFIIQPVSYNNKFGGISLLPVFLKASRGVLDNVKIIPQIHKILGVR